MTKREKYTYLRGIIAPVVTPFTDGGILNEDAFRAQAKFIMEAGVHGISPGGSTGEGCAIHDDERVRMIEIIAEENKRHIPIVAGIIRHSTRDAIKAGLECAAAGADALMVTPLQYLGGTDAAGNYRYYEAISNAVKLPIIIYNVVPQNVVTPDSVFDMLRGIEHVIGIKQSAGGVHSFMAMMGKCGAEGMMYAATDELPYTTYEMGADGEIAAILGLFPELSVRIWNLHERGKADEGMRLQKLVYDIWMSIIGPQFPRRLKAALDCIGRGCGGALAPLGRAPEGEYAQIKAALEPYFAYIAGLDRSE
ncbi:dihydrodipicolinate synthase family protein [bacterium]|nr:dihydrodipicolinate synthase family protein [bacterium]